MNLAENLLRTAEALPDKVAVHLDDVEVTYAQLAEGAARVAGMLQAKGVEPGDIVGIQLPNVPQMPIIYYGALWAGCAIVPMNPLYKAREISYVLEDSDAKALFVWEAMSAEGKEGAAEAGAECIVVEPMGFVAELAKYEPVPLVDRDGDDTAVVLYTSGTTGKPKGAQLSQSNMIMNAEVGCEIMDLKEDDVIFGGLPLFHAFGQTACMNGAIYLGATVTLLPRFEPTKTLEIFERDGVTVMMGVPTMYVALLNAPDKDDFDTSKLRICVSGGAAIPVEVIKGFEDAYGAMILEGYGLSETSPIASFNHFDRERKPGSVGQPIRGVEFKLVDTEWNEVGRGEPGEIAIKGHNVMKGYLNKPEATAEAMQDGWFRTGDIAKVDDDGYYFIVDRSKDMIIRGGYNVYPREIEEVLYEHPAVASVAVLGVPHDVHGEEVAAVIVLKEGAEATAEELQEYAKERVAAYKYPRIIRIVDELPLGPTGKILKREIKIED